MAHARSLTAALIGAGLVFGVAAAAGPGQAAVSVIGGGAAQACSEAAFKGRSDWRAEEACTSALDSEPMSAHDQAGTYVNRGVLRLRAGSYVGAAADFNSAERLNPKMGEIHVNRGVLYMAQERFEDAVSEINRGLELGVEEPAKAYYNRALAYEGLNNASAAYEDYLKAQALAPNWEAPARMLARFQVRTREIGG
jgi:tetratricopeptide (TPR) repeat protein